MVSNFKRALKIISLAVKKRTEREDTYNEGRNSLE